MDITQERQFEIDMPPNEIGDRLKKWAASAGFVCNTDTPQRWSFERGSQFAALYTFDIRKLPTTVNVALLSGSPPNLHCTFRVRSPFTISTSGDPKRVSEQLDILVAHIKGAL